MTRLGVVTGLAAEARCLRRGGAGDAPLFACSGGVASKAAGGARWLIDQGAEALLSFGIAGGLDPTLAPGSVVIAEAVIDGGGARHETHPAWRDAMRVLLARLSPIAAPVVGGDRPAVSAGAKQALYAAHGAAAADMESHAVALAALDAGLPFGVVRAIADPAGRALPRTALAGLGGDGEVRVGAVLAGLASRPWELPGLVMVALDTRRAFAALRRCAAAGGPLFGCGNLG